MACFFYQLLTGLCGFLICDIKLKKEISNNLLMSQSKPLLINLFYPLKLIMMWLDLAFTDILVAVLQCEKMNYIWIHYSIVGGGPLSMTCTCITFLHFVPHDKLEIQK